MNVKIENVEKNIVKLEIEVEAAALDEGLRDSYKKNAKRFAVPGFRKGKAPRHLVERYYGVEVLYEDAINALCPKYYEEALKENSIVPVGSPELDVVKIEKGEPFIFTVKVTVRPEAELGDYKGVEVEYNRVLITDEDIEKELGKIADRNGRIVPVEDRPAKIGDTINIDFDGTIDGEAFDGGNATGFDMIIGSSRLIKGFDEQIVGASLGDVVDVNVTFPEDYHAEELRGKKALFKVTINEMKMKEIPKVDDEFAQDVSEFGTLEEYKADIRKNMQESEEKKANQEFEEAVVRKVAENAEVEVPDEMIVEQFERNVRSLEMSLRYQGIGIDDYLKYTGVERSEFERKMKENAKKEIIAMLAISKVGKVEGIEVDQGDIDKEIEERAEKLKKGLEEYKAQMPEGAIEQIKDSLMTAKTIDFLVSNAVKI